ncbi:MAG: hypothetical protein OXP66_19330 [Candidatus Tectomicrobia bacterium]|nr:hypothetical protein [Candidatus Tectomicrobia bacterium]
MVAAACPGTMKKGRKARQPAGAVGGQERLDALDAEIARVREREERLALGRLYRAGYFAVRFRNGEFAEMFAKAFPVEGRRPSTLSRHEARRARRAGGQRFRSGAPGRGAGMAAAAGSGSLGRTMTAEERESLDPAGVLNDQESLQALDAEIARVREREERLALSRLDRAGYFGFRVTNGEFAETFPKAFLTETRRPSTLARLEGRRIAHYAGQRARDARRKALLGGFVVAQCRHKPEVHAAMVPDIRKWLMTHRNAAVGAKNVETLSGFFADAADKGLSGAPTNSKKARKERTHRLILLGAWVLARRGKLKGLLKDILGM